MTCLFILVPRIDELVGNWKSAISDKNWECTRTKSNMVELDCSGNKLSFFGSTIVWETTGHYGSYDGLDTINWRSGKWERRGILLNHFISFYRIKRHVFIPQYQ